MEDKNITEVQETENQGFTHILERETIKEIPVETIKEVIKEVEKEVIVELQGKVDFTNVASIFEALAEFNGEMENIAKNANNPFFKSAYLDLSAISNTVRPLLAKHGLSVVQYPVQDKNDRIAVNTILTHKSGEKIEFPGIFIRPSKVGDVQALGSTITYLRRYEISSILFVAGKDEDDDGNAATGRTETKSTPPTQAPGLPGLPKGRI